jgi:hypothetical protein
MWIILDFINKRINRNQNNQVIERFQQEFFNLCRYGYSTDGSRLLSAGNYYFYKRGCRPTAYNLMQLVYFDEIDFVKLLYRGYDLEFEYGIKMTDVAEFYTKKFMVPGISHSQNIINKSVEFPFLPKSSKQAFRREYEFIKSTTNNKIFHGLID